MMKQWMKATLCISLSLMCLFSCIGFAALSDDLLIGGSAEVEIPYGLFITSITTKSTSSVDENEVSYLPYSTTVDSTISRSGWSAGTVTYHVKVLNNTELAYSYRKIYYQVDLAGYNGNQYVSTTDNRRYICVTTSLDDATAEERMVEPKGTLEFDVTYKVGTSRSADTDWKTLINFQFGINVDGEREALEVVEDKFLDVLNTQSTYEQLIDALDNKFDGSQEWTSNYIGNVKGSSSEDSMAVNTLFSGQLQITVGDQAMDATVMIKHENLDGNVNTGDDYVAVNGNNGGTFRGYGCEMTLYLTVDQLETPNVYVPVYVVVFTCDRDENGNIVGDWYRIGSTYAGEANVVSYDGTGGGTGSFVTDHWRAFADTYPLIEGYSFNIDGEAYQLNGYSQSVGYQEGIKSIVSAKDANAVSTLQNLLNDAKRIIDNKNYAGVGIELVEEIYLKYSDFYTVDENGVHTVDADLTVAQLSPAMLDVYKVVNDALIKMDALSKQQ